MSDINEISTPRMKPGDRLIRRPIVQAHFGDCATSTIYEDHELMALRVRLAPESSTPESSTPESSKRSNVFWIEREVLELRDRRIAASAKPRPQDNKHHEV
jgi:hypothetical protein